MHVHPSSTSFARPLSRPTRLTRLTSLTRAVRVGCALVLVACARSATPRGSAASTQRPDVVSRAEISKTSASTAYDAVRLLRPGFLRSRGPTSISRRVSETPVVYVDGRRMGDLSTLRDIPVQMVFEIQYLSAPEAQTRWGSGHPGGVVHVISSRNRSGS